RFVEDQYTWVECQRPRERQQLLLAHRQRRATLGNRARIPVGQTLDERIGVHGARGGPHALLVYRRIAEPDVVRNGSREQVNVLENEAEQSAKIGEIQTADVDTIDRDAPARHIVE